MRRVTAARRTSALTKCGKYTPFFAHLQISANCRVSSRAETTPGILTHEKTLLDCNAAPPMSRAGSLRTLEDNDKLPTDCLVGKIFQRGGKCPAVCLLKFLCQLPRNGDISFSERLK